MIIVDNSARIVLPKKDDIVDYNGVMELLTKIDDKLKVKFGAEFSITVDNTTAYLDVQKKAIKRTRRSRKSNML